MCVCLLAASVTVFTHLCEFKPHLHLTCGTITRPQEFWEGLAAAKWSDRKAALTQLKELASYPRLVRGAGRAAWALRPASTT